MAYSTGWVTDEILTVESLISAVVEPPPPPSCVILALYPCLWWPSLVPRPSLTAFFLFYHGCEKSCEGMPGYEASGGHSTVLLNLCQAIY